MKFPSLGNRNVPKLARLQRIFPASIQLTTSSFGVKDRGQSKLYGGPQLSTKNLTTKPKTSRQKQNTSRQNRKPHGKNKIPHNKTKNLTAKPNTSHGNTSLYFISVYDVTNSLKKSFVQTVGSLSILVGDYLYNLLSHQSRIQKCFREFDSSVLCCFYAVLVDSLWIPSQKVYSLHYICRIPSQTVRSSILSISNERLCYTIETKTLPRLAR